MRIFWGLDPDPGGSDSKESACSAGDPGLIPGSGRYSGEGNGNPLQWVLGLLRNLYAGEETTVRTGQGTTDWFQIGKGVHQGCVLSPCLFNLYAEYIMRNAGLEETQVGIKIARRNINNLRYADDTTLWQTMKKN